MILRTDDDATTFEQVLGVTNHLIENDKTVFTINGSSSAKVGDVAYFVMDNPPHPYRTDVGYVTSVENDLVTVKVDLKTMNRALPGNTGAMFYYSNGEDVGSYTFTVNARHAMATRALVKYNSREDYNINLTSERIDLDNFYLRYLNGGNDQLFAVDCARELAWKVGIEEIAMTSYNGSTRSSIPLTVATNKFTI
jgi:hypothetical protein